jgi:transposase-like protein
MGRICVICSNPARANIDAELVKSKGKTTAVARAFNVSKKALHRHLHTHVKRSLDSANGFGGLTAASRIGLEVRKILQRNYRLSLQAEQQGKLAVAISAQRELLECHKFLARLQGVVDEKNVSTTNVVNLNVPESTLRRMVNMWLESHPAEPAPEPVDAPQSLLTLSAGTVEAGEPNDGHE